MLGDLRIALPDARRLQDDQVVSRCLAGDHHGIDIQRQLPLAAGGQRPEEHPLPVQGVHANAVAQQRTAAAPPGRIDREHRYAQLVLLIGAQAAHEFICERRFSGSAGAGDAQYGHLPHARRRGELGQIRRGQRILLQAGERSGQRRPIPAQHRIQGCRCARQILIAIADQPIDHARQAEPLPVLRREDGHPGRGQPLDLLVDDDPAAPAEDAHMPGPGLLQRRRQIFEVLDMPALIRADGDTLHILADRGVHHLAHGPVVPEVNDLGPLGLENPPHDVDGRVVAVEQRR